MEGDMVTPPLRTTRRTNKRVIKPRALEILSKAGGAVEIGSLLRNSQ
jgi:hypothetical protein